MKHSKKPEFFQDLIEQVSESPRLEMFARRERDGWDVSVTRSTTLLIWNGIVAMAYNVIVALRSCCILKTNASL